MDDLGQAEGRLASLPELAQIVRRLDGLVG
jgi:hypothetical protein